MTESIGFLTLMIVVMYSNFSLSLYITRIIKNVFNKNERRCRDVKTQKACKQGWEANIGPKIRGGSRKKFLGGPDASANYS